MTQTLEPVATVDRLKIYKVSPELYDAMMTLSNAAAKDLDPTIAELIKIRASQLNRCAFCLDMHTHDARQNGETEQRLNLIAAWEEAGDLFTEQEQAALALAEAVTDLSHGPVSDAVYARAAAAFTERELGQAISMAVTINAWNRINAVVKAAPPRR
ncbi:carboxymuconolactone decarboxylase family protein [Mycobacterium sp. 20091114027_K0903767]|nr:carboxymuconolactone decarboxylase family protein [Mycobacterium sp. 20091114027_K0903767]